MHSCIEHNNNSPDIKYDLTNPRQDSPSPPTPTAPFVVYMDIKNLRFRGEIERF